MFCCLHTIPNNHCSVLLPTHYPKTTTVVFCCLHAIPNNHCSKCSVAYTLSLTTTVVFCCLHTIPNNHCSVLLPTHYPKTTTVVFCCLHTIPNNHCSKCSVVYTKQQFSFLLCTALSHYTLLHFTNHTILYNTRLHNTYFKTTLHNDKTQQNTTPNAHYKIKHLWWHNPTQRNSVLHYIVHVSDIVTS